MLVPKEPTRDMLNAAVDATGAGSGMSWANRSPQTLFEQGYKGMIAAAPTPPVVRAIMGKRMRCLPSPQAAPQESAMATEARVNVPVTGQLEPGR